MQSTRFHEEAGAFAFLSTFCQPLLKVGIKMMQWAMSLFECVFYMRTQIAACCEDILDVDSPFAFICRVDHNMLHIAAVNINAAGAHHHISKLHWQLPKCLSTEKR